MLGPEYHVKQKFVKDGATPESNGIIRKHLVLMSSSEFDYITVIPSFPEDLESYHHSRIRAELDSQNPGRS